MKNFNELDAKICSCTDALNAKLDGSNGKRAILLCGGTGCLSSNSMDIKAAFEELVAKLLLKMGYGGSENDILQNRGKSGDEGIDGIIKQDVLGLDKIYIQAKRWSGNVSRPEVQKFVGAVHGQNASRGVFITTSSSPL